MHRTSAQDIQRAAMELRRHLLAERGPDGVWAGELSASALSTATAVCALATVAHERGDGRFDALIEGGLRWLAGQANADGGWGDTVLSLSNISTTTLGWAAFGSVPGADERYRSTVANAERWLTRAAGGTAPAQLVPAIVRRYGKDRTFSVPILTMCVIGRRLGLGADAWRHVMPLPFELAALPARFYAAARLPVVSYALPALIAIGQVRHDRLPTRNPVTRWLRDRTRARTLEVLARIQPTNGGFLEATPLTSFVTMSLAASGQAHHQVARKGTEFLAASVRGDGSWAIDTNLSTWVTTLAVNGLAAGGELGLAHAEREALTEWLLAQQYRTVHPYTNAAPGGWAWTNLPGGVPDADDTPGALLALHHLGRETPAVRAAVSAGVTWLLDLQNGDGGIPTFCRGWGTLPFDRSSPDLTAHTLRAWVVWRDELPSGERARVQAGIDRALRFLDRCQRRDGSWVPLWFGNQHAPGDENPVYGTAKVVKALAELRGRAQAVDLARLARAVSWLVAQQQPDGAWGGVQGTPVSMEETALAVEALAAVLQFVDLPATANPQAVQHATLAGAAWLGAQVRQENWRQASPIGFYFAKLWYYEKLYPLVFTAGALERVGWLLRQGRL